MLHICISTGPFAKLVASILHTRGDQKMAVITL